MQTATTAAVHSTPAVARCRWHVSVAVTNRYRYAFHINSSLALFFFPKGRVSQIVELNSELGPRVFELTCSGESDRGIGWTCVGSGDPGHCRILRAHIRCGLGDASRHSGRRSGHTVSVL